MENDDNVYHDVFEEWADEPLKDALIDNRFLYYFLTLIDEDKVLNAVLRTQLHSQIIIEY